MQRYFTIQPPIGPLAPASYYRSGPATAEPVTIVEAYRHLRLDEDPTTSPQDEEVPLVSALISAARERAEDYTGRCFAPGPYVAQYHCFPAGRYELLLPVAPVASVTGVSYADADGVVQPFTDWEFDPNPDAPCVRVKRAIDWPSSLDPYNPIPVIVSFEGGYTDAVSPNWNPTPARVGRAVLLMMGALYEHREDTVIDKDTVQTLPMGFEAQLAPMRRAML